MRYFFFLLFIIIATFYCVTDSLDFVSMSLTDASHRRRSVRLKHSPYDSARLLVTVVGTLRGRLARLRSLTKVVLKRFEGRIKSVRGL